MTNGKRVAKNTLYLYFRMFIVMIVSLYTVRVIISVLGVNDYGIYSAVGGIVLIMNFLSSTLTSAAQRFFSFELGREDYIRLNRIFFSIVFLYLLLALFVILIAEIVGVWFLENKMIIPEERMYAAHWVLHFSLMSFLVTIMYSPYNAILIAHENMKIYAYVSIFEAFIKLLIVYLLQMSMYDKLILYAFLIFSAHFVVALIYGVYCYRSYQETHIRLSLEKPIIKELSGYTSWTMFGTLAGAANNQGANLLLNSFFGPIANTSYSISNQVSHVLQLFGVNLFNAIRPPMIKKYACGQYDEVLDLLYKSTKYISLLLMFIILPLFFEIHFVLSMWLGNVVEYMVDFSQLMMLYVIILQLSNPLTIIAQAANKVKSYHGIVDSFVLLILVISYLLFSMGAPAQSLFWAMLAIMLVAHFIRLIVVHGIISFSYSEYFKMAISPSILIALPTSLSLIFLHQFMHEGWIRLFYSVLLSSVIIGFVSYLLLEEKEKSFVKKQLKLCKN